MIAIFQPVINSKSLPCCVPLDPTRVMCELDRMDHAWNSENYRLNDYSSLDFIRDLWQYSYIQI